MLGNFVIKTAQENKFNGFKSLSDIDPKNWSKTAFKPIKIGEISHERSSPSRQSAGQAMSLEEIIIM